MALVYKCDACGVIMEDPYLVGMKEFCIVATPASAFQKSIREKKQIHLCDTCFHNLNSLAIGSKPGGTEESGGAESPDDTEPTKGE